MGSCNSCSANVEEDLKLDELEKISIRSTRLRLSSTAGSFVTASSMVTIPLGSTSSSEQYPRITFSPERNRSCVPSFESDLLSCLILSTSLTPLPPHRQIVEGRVVNRRYGPTVTQGGSMPLIPKMQDKDALRQAASMDTKLVKMTRLRY